MKRLATTRHSGSIRLQLVTLGCSHVAVRRAPFHTAHPAGVRASRAGENRNRAELENTAHRAVATKSRRSPPPSRSAKPGRRRSTGFTLLEILLAVTILAIVTTITYLAFSTMTRAWKRGNSLSENLGHGDYVTEQLVMALRSSYCPSPGPRYGFRLEDRGDGPGSSDVMSWVKLGKSLVGSELDLSGSPHRTVFAIERGDDGFEGAAVKAWSLLDETEDFDPDQLPFATLSGRIVGFNCRASEKGLTEDTEWLDAWDEEDLTNHVPRVLELTLYLEPLEKGDRAVEIKRVIDIPCAELSWQAVAP